LARVRAGTNTGDGLNKLQDSGGFHQPWALGSIALVPKPKGNPLSMDDHRGFAMGPALGKLFSLMLMKHLDGWAEKDNLRAETRVHSLGSTLNGVH
jgi:hypothetical protein